MANRTKGRPKNLPSVRGIMSAEMKRTSGMPGGLIEEYGLGGFVRQQRMKGKTYREITEAINNGNMLPNGYKIAHSTVTTWCGKNGLSGNSKDPSELHAINIYEREVKMLNAIRETMSIIMTKMDDISKQVGLGTVDVKDLKSMVDMIDKLSIREQSLTQDVGRMQERIYNYEQVSKAFGIIDEILSNELDQSLYNKIMSEFGRSPMLVEALRPIVPTGAA